ncbi:unnamed protein product [Bemisia tabaci]|uniref:Uncharacterized protein n=1 Tax=Bemisia tabaci TaxID=7038 RepID=A0A9P0A9G8_BEMTA|nr:unnamed protein product [Bemisia tabaci]
MAIRASPPTNRATPNRTELHRTEPSLASPPIPKMSSTPVIIPVTHSRHLRFILQGQCPSKFPFPGVRFPEDFEAYLEQIHGDSEHPASAYRRHISNYYAYLLVTDDPEFKMSEAKLYRGEEAHIKFLDDIITRLWLINTTLHSFH